MKRLTRPFLLLLLLLTCHLRVFSQAKIPLEVYVANLKAIHVESQGKPCRFLCDTGGGETIVSQEVAGVKTTDTAGEEELPKVPLVVVSNKTYVAPVRMKEILYDGALNFDFIHENVYYLDLKRLEVWRK